ncbi:MAG: DUF3820 family protein [Bacteroidales bacterium]|nr:DUF3820 family protein [Bacteroidales bacterium]
MIQLRSNQTAPIQKAIEYFNEKKPKPSLIVLPTAWGKSILTAYVALNCNDRLLVLQPSKELLEQNIRKYYALCDGFALNAGIYSASFGRKKIAQITYATIGSIKNLGERFKEMGFTKVLIDEAHLYPREADSMLGRFLKDSGITHVLGITATPVKLQQNYDQDGGTFSKLVMLTSRSKKGNFFKEIIHVGQVREMVELGFWSKLRYEASDFDSSLLVYNTSKSEFTEDSVLRAYNANGGAQGIIEALDNHTDRRHILVFCPSVQDAIDLSARYAGSAVIYGDMKPAERATIINDFKAGKIRVIFNVRVLSTGFDYTGIDCIILGISTASIALYYQIIGRATRIDKDKEDALIIDLGGNVSRFGRVEDITFEKGKIWRMFGSGGRLLSGIPITDIGKVTREDTVQIDARAAQPIEIMPFGKYKGERLTDIPLNYRQWMLRTFEWNARNEKLRKSIIATM